MIIRFARLASMAWRLCRHDALLPKEYASRLPLPIRLFGSLSRLFAKNKTLRPGQRLAIALASMGPAQIKLGQFLAGRPDVLGLEVATDLTDLQDNLPPFPISEAKKLVEDQLGGPLEKYFKQFDEPVAAASIAQVHKAITTQGDQVAVKLLRPGLRERLDKDIQAFKLGAKIAQKFIKVTRRLEPVAFMETMEVSLVRELDFRLEAVAISRFAKIEKKRGENNQIFRIPAIDWQRSSEKILTMEWIDGVKPKTDAMIANAVADRKALAQRVTRGFLEYALGQGFFHADMHPGNIIIDDQERPVLIDFGIMGRLTPAQRRYLADILWAFSSQDYHRSARAHFAAGYVPSHHNIDDFALALQATGEPILGKTADQISMKDILLQLWDITARFDMHLRPELVLLQKTLVQVEGLTRQIYPQHDLWDSSKPVLKKYIARQISPQGLVERLSEDARVVMDSIKKLPRLVDEMEAFAAANRERRARKKNVLIYGLLGLILLSVLLFLLNNK